MTNQPSTVPNIGPTGIIGPEAGDMVFATRAEFEAAGSIPQSSTVYIAETDARYEFRSDPGLSSDGWAVLDGGASGHFVTVSERLSIAPGGEIWLVGIRFAPGGALPFLTVSPSEIRDAAPSLDDVAVPFETDLIERLAAAPPGTEGALLDDTLGRRLDRARRVTDRRVRASVRAAFTAPRPMTVDGLVSLTGLGARQLERQFRQHVGYGPKTLCRLTRFQRVVRAVEPDGDVSWARLAADNAYADQSHMSREFREFAGTTLTEYVRELHPMSDRFHSGPIDEISAR